MFTPGLGLVLCSKIPCVSSGSVPSHIAVDPAGVPVVWKSLEVLDQVMDQVEKPNSANRELTSPNIELVFYIYVDGLDQQNKTAGWKTKSISVLLQQCDSLNNLLLIIMLLIT